MNKIKDFQEEGRSIILVSHNAAHITEICDRAIILEHGTVIGIENPSAAVEKLRHMYDEQAIREAKELASVRLFNPSDDAECLIDDVSIIEGTDFDKETQTHYITSGNTVSFAFDLSTPTTLDDYEFMFEVRDRRDQFIFGTSSWNIDGDLAPIKGQGRVILTIPNFNLGSGIYYVNLVIKKSNGKGLARSDNAIIFAVRSDEASNGFVYATPHLSMG